jgi:hypothetical protein
MASLSELFEAGIDALANILRKLQPLALRRRREGDPLHVDISHIAVF